MSAAIDWSILLAELPVEGAGVLPPPDGSADDATFRELLQEELGDDALAEWEAFRAAVVEAVGPRGTELAANETLRAIAASAAPEGDAGHREAGSQAPTLLDPAPVGRAELLQAMRRNEAAESPPAPPSEAAAARERVPVDAPIRQPRTETPAPAPESAVPRAPVAERSAPAPASNGAAAASTGAAAASAGPDEAAVAASFAARAAQPAPTRGESARAAEPAEKHTVADVRSQGLPSAPTETRDAVRPVSAFENVPEPPREAVSPRENVPVNASLPKVGAAPAEPAPVEPNAVVATPATRAATAVEAPAATREAPLPPAPVEDLPARIEWMAQRGGGSARIELDPPQLGRVDVVVRLRGSDVEVVIAAKEPAALAAVQAQRGQLVENLAARDLRLSQLDVSSSNDQGPAHDSRSNARADAGSDERSERSHEPHRSPLAASRDGGEATPLAPSPVNPTPPSTRARIDVRA